MSENDDLINLLIDKDVIDNYKCLDIGRNCCVNDFVLNQDVVMSNVRNDGVETKGNSRNLVAALLAAEAYIFYYYKA